MDTGGTDVVIEINNFEKELWTHLKKLFNICDYWHYFGNFNDDWGMCKIIQIFSQWHKHKTICDSIKVIYNDSDERHAIQCLLNEILDSLTDNNDNNNQNANSLLVHEISIYSVMAARINITHASGYHFLSIDDMFAGYLSFLSQKEIEKVLQSLLMAHDLYIDEDDDMEHDVVKQWCIFFQKLLKQCGDNFLASHAKSWFPIACFAASQYEQMITRKEWNDFIIDKIFCKFTTQSAFEFGLYLVDFVVYHQNNDKMIPLDARYFEFLQEHVGITWNLT